MDIITDPLLFNDLLRIITMGLIGLVCWMIRSILTRFKKMEKETYKIESNHLQTQKQFDGLQQQMTIMLNTLLNREGNTRAQYERAVDKFITPTPGFKEDTGKATIINKNKGNVEVNVDDC